MMAGVEDRGGGRGPPSARTRCTARIEDGFPAFGCAPVSGRGLAVFRNTPESREAAVGLSGCGRNDGSPAVPTTRATPAVVSDAVVINCDA